jgi:4-hydroxybenzoate polyprenyltransferase
VTCGLSIDDAAGKPARKTGYAVDVTTADAPSLSTLRALAADIKLSHSVFALPFALLAACMAAAHAGDGSGGIDWSRFSGQLVLIVLAMVFARTVAMLANRLFDAHIDKDNPRTAGRAIPSGRVSPAAASGALLACAAGFMAICVAFGLFFGNWWPSMLGLPVLGWISAYALFKRFTSLCHVYLGSSLAISPLAAALAIEPAALSQPALWLISAMVLCWVAGFDIIYALQDVAVDTAQGLFSIPSRFGENGALWISRVLHVIAAACLVIALIVDVRLAMLFGIGVAAVTVLLIYEHTVIARHGISKITLAFFTLNGIISCLLGVLGIADVLVA